MTPPGSHAPATARPRQRDPNGGQPATGRIVPEAVAPSLLSPRTGRLLVENSMIDANPQVPQDRLPGQPDNQVPGSVGKEPVGERAGQVRVKQQGPASAAADQQGAGRKVYVPPLQATVSPTRSQERHMMSDATRARQSPRAARESRSRSTWRGFQ